MHRNRLRNLLSFGPDAQELTLEPLNVFIGPNGSGKSNLIDAIGTRILAERPEFVWMHSTALPLEKSDIETVLSASDLDWSEIRVICSRTAPDRCSRPRGRRSPARR